MKTVTRYLVGFAIAAFLLTIAFKCSLSFSLDRQQFVATKIFSVLYALSMFAFGWFFGKKDGAYLPIFDVGFRFHFTTFVIHNLVCGLWFLLKLNSVREKAESFYTILIVWGILLLAHFIIYLALRKKTIDGLNRDDLFE